MKDDNHLEYVVGARKNLAKFIPPALLQEIMGGPKFIQKYEVVRPIGRGGMGQVFLANDEALSRRVAIKLMLDAVDGEQLQLEAIAAAAVEHPNVVEIFEFGIYEGRPFFVMPYIEGNLSSWLSNDKGPQRPQREILETFIQIARGLFAVHEHGHVHGDLKPRNVLMRVDASEVLVADFGLARAFGEPAGASAGMTNTAADSFGSQTLESGRHSRRGTPRYMSPEQSRGEPLLPASDQFSFCVALYEALWPGERPFSGKRAGVASGIAESQESPRPPDSHRAQRRLWEIVRRGLADDPTQRWLSMHELECELQRVIEDDERRPHRRRGYFVASACILAGVCIGALAFDMRRADARAQRCRAQNADQLELIETRVAKTNTEFAPLLREHWSALELNHTLLVDDCLAAEQDPELLALAWGCEEQMLIELDTFTDGRVPSRSQLLDLPHPSECNPRNMSPLRPPRFWEAPMVDYVRQELAQVSALWHLGDFEAAQAQLATLEPLAATVDYPLLEVELAFHAANVATGPSRELQGLQLLEATYQRAFELKHHALALDAGIALAMTSAVTGKPESARAQALFLRPIWKQHGRSPRQGYNIDFIEASIAFYADDSSVDQRIAGLLEAMEDPRFPARRRAPVLMLAARRAKEQGQAKKTISLAKRALDEAKIYWGIEHHQLARYHLLLATLYTGTQAYERAQEQLLLAFSLAEKYTSVAGAEQRDAADMTDFYLARGTLQLGLREFAAAKGSYAEAYARARGNRDASWRVVRTAAVDYHSAYGQHRVEQLAKEARTWAEMMHDSPDEDDSERRLAILADLALSLGESASARALLGRILATKVGQERCLYSSLEVLTFAQEGDVQQARSKLQQLREGTIECAYYEPMSAVLDVLDGSGDCDGLAATDDSQRGFVVSVLELVSDEVLCELG